MVEQADTSQQRPRVLILGGGFAGVGAARQLKGADVDVVIVDSNNYHTFQPMLYQVATALLDASAVAHPLRGLFHDQPNADVYQATVNAIDLEKREVSFDEMRPMAYDYLVVALGARVSYFGVEGAAEHALPLYTLPDAVRMREHLLLRWEAAGRDPSLAETGALNVVVVGGGPTGVESAGALAELYETNFARDYPRLAHDQAKVTLVEAAPELFSMFKRDLRTYAKRALEKRGVEVMVGEVVESVTADAVTLRSGKVLPAQTLVWAAGLQAHPLGEALGVELQHGRRVPVELDLRVAGHPELFVLGDIAWITDGKTGEVLPQLGSVAMQAGQHAGKNIARLVKGQEPEPFRYHDKGTMATIGRGAGVIQFAGGRTMKGKTAWLAWGAVHLALLSSGEDRAKAIVDWTWAGFTHERGARITFATVPEDDPLLTKR
jgi:NADH:quinone reductase (non-electrogenic)